MKKIFAIVFALIMIFSLAACGSEKEGPIVVDGSGSDVIFADLGPMPTVVSDAFLGNWIVAEPAEGETYAEIQINDEGKVSINGTEYPYTLSAYSSDNDPELLVDKGDGTGYQLSIYGSYEPVDMYFYNATFDAEGVHIVGDGIQYIK